MDLRFTRREFIRTMAAATGGLSLSALEALGSMRLHAPKAIPLDAIGVGLADLEPITVRVGEDRIVLESGPRFRIADCRSILYWRPRGRLDWVGSPSSKFQNLTGPPERRSFTIPFGDLRAEIVVTQFAGDRVWRLTGRLTNLGKEPVELARFHYLDGGIPAGLGFLELMGARGQPELRWGLATFTPRADREQFWKSMAVSWPQLADPIHDQAGWFVSTDIAVLVEGWSAPGWGFGFIGPGSAFGEIGYRGLATRAQGRGQERIRKGRPPTSPGRPTRNTDLFYGLASFSTRSR